MSIKWRGKFKPSPVIDRIASVRTYSEDGKASYSAFVLEECMPTLHSMLNFPSAAAEVDQGTLVWQALKRVGKELTAESFIKAINDELNARLATKEIQYSVLTSISLLSAGLFRSVDILDCKIRLMDSDFPEKYIQHRKDLINRIKTKISETPSDYCKVVATVCAKSPSAAFHKAMRAIDLLRSLMCLKFNHRMQITFGGPSYKAINSVQLGGYHTVHLADGTSAGDGYWYEPYFKPMSAYVPNDPAMMSKDIRLAIKEIGESNFNKALVSSLLMYVRGFDLHDQNAAFLKVWGALEMLTTPNAAEYEKLIKRSSFLFKETDYQRQVLEHLRQYRNANIHAGEESDNARIHCFQLQTFYSAVAWFCIRNGSVFSSLEELGDFLDLPSELSALERQLNQIKRALKFRSENVMPNQ